MIERDTLSLFRLLADRPIPLRHLLEAYGEASNVIDHASAEILCSHGVEPGSVRRCRNTYAAAVARDLQWLDGEANHLVTIDQDAYPSLLREIHDPPPILFARGDLTLLDRPAVAIVGSRRASRLGLDTAHKLGKDLSACGLVIVSGLARGIDGAGHRGALAGNGETIAVLGSGCDVIYPSKHMALAHEIVFNGAVLSEFPLRTRPAPWHFPRRNRIVSGLSLGTVVVEAALPSGSLISARAALEQGREVFAIPGPVNRSHSRGCHQLLREGATLVESAEDVVNGLSFLAGTFTASDDHQRDEAVAALNSEQQSIMATLQSDAVSADQVAALTGLAIEVVISTLIDLEILGLVYQQAGAYCRS